MGGQITLEPTQKQQKQVKQVKINLRNIYLIFDMKYNYDSIDLLS